MRIRNALRAYWVHGGPVERAGYLVGALLFASGLFHLAVYAVAGGPWEGPVSWRKAVTFGLSFGLTLVTVTWIAALLPLRDRTRTWLLATFATACVTETAIVSLQVWRGVPSHFNVATPLDSALTRVLAAGGGVLVVVLVTLTVLALRASPGSLAPSLLPAIRIGLLSLLGAGAVGAVMIATGMSEVAAGHQQAAYLNGGWLKPAHAALMHGVTVLPALAWLASFTGWDESRRVRVTWLGAGGYLLFAAVVSAEAFARVPPLHAPVLAAVLAAAGLAALLTAGVWTVARVTADGPAQAPVRPRG